MQLVSLVANSIEMKSSKNISARTALQNNDSNNQLIAYEAQLRKKAYSNSVININDSFFDDSDMIADYYLVVVYDQISHTPLLSARYFYDKTTIEKYLKGDLESSPPPIFNNNPFNLSDYKNDTIFLADRLSGNITHPLYRAYRKELFNTFYNEIKRCNLDKTLILMVREDKQVKKYIALEFNMIGNVIHKGLMHTIITIKIK